MKPSEHNEMERLSAVFAAARAAESAAMRQIDVSLENHCRDMELIHKVTEDMLQAHNDAMYAYFELMKFKLHPELLRERNA